jgi:hypothetical protein
METGMSFRPSSLLSYALAADAAASGATGLMLALGAGPLSGLLEMPEPLLRWSGLVLVPYAALIGFVASRGAVARTTVLAIVVVNALWVADSFALLASGWVAPSLLGSAFIIAQALAVGLLALAQYVGLRGSSARAVATA